MWKCKKCGGEVMADIEINDYFCVALNKNYEPDNYLEEVKESIKNSITGICCDECGNGRNTVDELKEIAVWED